MTCHRAAEALRCWTRLLLFLLAPTIIPTATIAADQLSGTVRNQSRNIPAVDDEVVLIQLEGGTPQESRTRTDAQGAFHFEIQHAERPCLVRVLHQGVSYDQQARAGGQLALLVFDAAPSVANITGSIEILRAGTNGNLLHVSDMYEIKNESSPPLTLDGDRTFDVYLPPDAKIDSVLAAGPEGIAAMISAAQVPGDPGHFTVRFPIRPGATKFAFNYDVAYNGRVVFHSKHAYPLQQLAVMFPPTMHFSSRSPIFRFLSAGNPKYQVQAATQLAAGIGPSFEIAGTGPLPLIADSPAQSALHSQVHAGLMAQPTTPSPSIAASPAVIPAESPRRSAGNSLAWASSMAIVFLFVCALMVWKTRQRRASRVMALVSSTAPFQRSPNLASSLLRELSQLEADRRSGSISEEEYASTRQAIDAVLKPFADRNHPLTNS